ncbi:unnamed protein product [Acanthosepion pharaonis]|uniref:Uncharacterized protein n=1 Tax=Acanthosepion pharaonis TaxID=158019 RepID=A0A812AQT3_ACAPH|nr:unnamed protein product [Sepia pharaonis]
MMSLLANAQICVSPSSLLGILPWPSPSSGHLIIAISFQRREKSSAFPAIPSRPLLLSHLTKTTDARCFPSQGRGPPIPPPDTYGPMCNPTPAPASPGDVLSTPLSPSTNPHCYLLDGHLINPTSVCTGTESTRPIVHGLILFIEILGFPPLSDLILAQFLLPLIVFGVGTEVSRPLPSTHSFPHFRKTSSLTPEPRHTGLSSLL